MHQQQFQSQFLPQGIGRTQSHMNDAPKITSRATETMAKEIIKEVMVPIIEVVKVD